MLSPEVITDAAEVAEKARKKFGNFASLHEAFAVLAEEVDELKEWVQSPQSMRDHEAIRSEALDIAAVALRIANGEYVRER